MSLEEIIQDTRIDPLWDKHRQSKKQLVIHRPETSHNQQENNELHIFQDATHIPEYAGKRLEQTFRTFCIFYTSRLLIEQQQDKIQWNNPGRYIKDKDDVPLKSKVTRGPKKAPIFTII